MRFPLAAVVAAFCFSCASAAPIDYGSVEHPKAGCFIATPKQNATIAGKFQPEIVISIGLTELEDGERVKVLRAPDFNPDRWEPHLKEEVVFGARCRAGGDLQQMFDASRGGVDAASKPPNK
jgi:hypothetical protein